MIHEVLGCQSPASRLQSPLPVSLEDRRTDRLAWGRWHHIHRRDWLEFRACLMTGWAIRVADRSKALALPLLPRQGYESTSTAKWVWHAEISNRSQPSQALVASLPH